MQIGYARISTIDQNLALQRDALKKAGCEKIIADEASGKLSNRQGFGQLKRMLRAGDTLIVWRLDRLGRSLKHLIEIINELEQNKVGFVSLTEQINTTTPSGKLTFHIFAALAEFERNLIVERTKAGLAAARARGKLGGRRKKINPQQRKLVASLYRAKQHSIGEICRMFNISKPTLYSYVNDPDLQ